MPYEPNTNIADILAVLTSNNTTTVSHDLSEGLNTRLKDQDIIKQDPLLERPRVDRLPAVYITINNDEEEFAGIGNTGVTGAKKMMTVNYDIYGLIGKYGGHSQDVDLLTEVYDLSRNIRTVFQNNVQLGTPKVVLDSNVVTANYANIEFERSFMGVVLINFQVRYLFR